MQAVGSELAGSAGKFFDHVKQFQSSVVRQGVIPPVKGVRLKTEVVAQAFVVCANSATKRIGNMMVKKT